MTPNVREAIDRADSAVPDIIDALVRIALDPAERARDRVAASNAVLDRAMGKPAQAITGADGEPLHSMVDLAALSDEELDLYVKLNHKAIVAGRARSGDGTGAGPGGEGAPGGGAGTS